MFSLFRWLLRIFIGLSICALGAAILFYWFLSRSIPDYNAGYELAGIQQPVEIVRNSDNVPHILGKTDSDVFFALGFVHAQDRLWQMTMLRRTAQGRLSELFGKQTVAIDEMMRRYDLQQLARQSYEVLDEPTRQALQAYARGVNSWIAQVNEQALGRGAPEFFLVSGDIAAWTPTDSLIILKLMALQLSGQLENEVLRARMSLILPPERLRDILPDSEGGAVVALPSYAGIAPSLQPSYQVPDNAAQPLSPFPDRDLAGASNAWAVAPARSAAGATLLANDPHLRFSAPVIWYLARLDLQSGPVIGATIPGVPAVLLGRSDALGWGMTTTYLDDQDLFLEKRNPDNLEEYLTPTGWKRFETRSTIIQVKDDAPVTITLRWTDNGPVLPAGHYGLGALIPEGYVMSLGWSGFEAKDRSMMAALRLMKAKNIAEGMEAGQFHVAPAQNLMLADRNNIALQVVGAMPKRDPNHQTKGRMPAPGWLAQNRWQGYFPYADNPRFENPVGGILGNMNNKIIDRAFPNHLSFDWGDMLRIQRWRGLMQSRDVHTRDSFIEAQLDTVSPAARNLLPLIGAELWYNGPPAPEGTPERLRQKALELLANWNGDMNEHLPEPLIYQAWMRHLQKRLIRDEVGPLTASFKHIDPVFLERVFRNTDGAGVWCDIVQSAAVESCPDIARLALDEALLDLSEQFGPKVESWRWGDVHQTAQDHPVLGKMALLRYFANIRFSSSGDDHTLMRAQTQGGEVQPYLNVHGAGYRGVYDFADPDSSVFITSTGQSGHFLSRHYDNLGELWRRGEYISMSLDPALARAAAVGITWLRPAP